MQPDYPLLYLVLLIFPLSYVLFLRKSPARTAVLITLYTIAGIHLLLNISKPWNLPAWVEKSQVYWLLGSFSGMAGWLCTLSRQLSRKSIFWGLLGFASWVGILLNVFVYQSYPTLGQQIAGDGAILQTSHFSCAPASGANIAKLYNLKITERKMAQLMHTRHTGTTSSEIVEGLRSIGLVASRFETSPNVYPIPTPAILIVDHPKAGKESHAIAALSYLQGGQTLIIVDPLQGTRMIKKQELAKIWHGHGIQVSFVQTK